LGERRDTPWTGCQRGTATLRHRDKQSYTLTPKVNLETLSNLTGMFLGFFGKKQEYLERNHTYMGRTCKLHTERPQPGFEQGTLLL